MKESEPKIKEPKRMSLYKFLDFLEGEFGENVTNELFKLPLEKRAHADIVLGSPAKEVRIERLKGTKITPITVAKLNLIINIHSKSLETDLRQIALRHSERFENIRKEKEEMLKAMKGKEIVMDGEGNIEVKTQT